MKLIAKILVIVVLVSSVSYAQVEGKITRVEEDDEEYIIEDYTRFEQLEDPTVALALTGGGAKALFNIGVIKALEEAKIPIDIIVGSSMGAIIGTMYGSGLSIEQIEEIVTTTSFSDMLDLNLGSSESILRTAKFNQFIENVAPNQDLKNFPLPTALLSLELISGNKYLTTQGNISEVMQASYAIPYYFPIYQRQDQVFADPGIVENSPAKAATVLGADFVIATVARGDIAYNQYDTPSKIAGRYLELIELNNTARIIDQYSDQVIYSNVGAYSFLDFNAAQELIEIGYQDTKEKLPAIKEALQNQDIQLSTPQQRPKQDLTQELLDLKYDRLLIDQLNVYPRIHYGQNRSFFEQDLIRNHLLELQYGLELNYDQLSFSSLVVNNEQLESKLRWKKLAPTIDLLAKTRLHSSGEVDATVGLEYYTPDYTLGGGLGSVANQEYIYLDNSYQTKAGAGLELAGETDLIFSEPGWPQVLTSQQLCAKLSDIWSLEGNLVFNNTDLLSSPVIYRGSQPVSTVDLQLGIDYLYTHQFINNFELSQAIQMSDIGFYFFTDYKQGNQSALTYGLGTQGNFYLLGLKPFDVEMYLGYEEQTEQTKTGIKLDYKF